MANTEKTTSAKSSEAVAGNNNTNHEKARQGNHNKSATEQTRETLQQTGQTIGEKKKSAAEQLRQQTSELGAAMSDYVRKRPCTALGVAALIGITAGFLLRR